MKKLESWREKSLFMLPSGATRKMYVAEASSVMKLWIYDTPLKLKLLKAAHVTPTLLFQKPWRYQKGKDHLQALERHIILLVKGEIEDLLRMVKLVKKKVKFEQKMYHKFKNLMSKEILTHFMPLISFDNPWKHQKTSDFLIFSRGIKRDKWHEIG